MRDDANLELQFVANTAFSSRMIEWFGAGHYSHVDIVWPDGRLYGARSDRMKVDGVRYPSGVQYRPANYETWREVRRIRIPCARAQRNRGLEWAQTQENKKYDHWAILAFAVDRNWREDDRWFCSELASAMLEQAFDIELPLTPNKITPGTCAVLASALAVLRAA